MPKKNNIFKNNSQREKKIFVFFPHPFDVMSLMPCPKTDEYIIFSKSPLLNVVLLSNNSYLTAHLKMN